MTTKVCRVCGGLELLKSIAGDAQLLEILYICANIKVSDDDLLPKLLCQQCEWGLQFSYQLRQKGEETEKRLRFELEKANSSQQTEREIAEDSKTHINRNTIIENVSPLKKENLIECISEAAKTKIIPKNEKGSIQSTMGKQIVFQTADNDALADMEFDELEFQSEQPEDKEIKGQLTVPESVSSLGFEYQNEEHLDEYEQNATHDIIEEILDSEDDQEYPEKIMEQNSNYVQKSHHSLQNADDPENLDPECDMVHQHEVPNSETVVAVDCSTQIHSTIDIDLPKEPTKEDDVKVYSYTCATCHRVLLSQREYREHIKIHGDQRFQCMDCNKWFPTRTRLQKHQKSHMKYAEQHKCDQCDRAYCVRSNLLRHIRNTHETKSFICAKCGEGFGRPDVLKTHMTTHKEENEFKCDICSHSFKSLRYLNSHKGRHARKAERKTPEKKSTEQKEPSKKLHFCHYCGKESKHLFAHKMHMRTHTHERPHKCETCGKSFRTLAALIAHERIHVDARPYQCEHCLLSFRQQSHLKEHRMIHEGVTPHICSICKLSFTKKSNMQVHMRIHSGEKPYKCMKCGEQFSKQISLRRHERTAHGEGYTAQGRPQSDANLAELTVLDSEDSNLELDVGREQFFDVNGDIDDPIIGINSTMNVMTDSLCTSDLYANFCGDVENFANADNAGVVLVVDDDAKFNSLFIMDD